MLKSALTTLTYDSGWIRFEPNSSTNMSVYRKVGVTVYVQVVVNANSIAANTLIGTLPVGFRPDKQKVMANYRPDDNENQISVTSDGKVTKQGSGGSWLNCCISYPV